MFTVYVQSALRGKGNIHYMFLLIQVKERLYRRRHRIASSLTYYSRKFRTIVCTNANVTLCLNSRVKFLSKIVRTCAVSKFPALRCINGNNYVILYSWNTNCRKKFDNLLHIMTSDINLLTLSPFCT